MDDLNQDPVTLHVDDRGGSGRPVVLIHGWPLSGEAWAHQVPALMGAGYRVITYDRRGFGRSDKTGTRYDYDVLADDLAGILDRLDLRDVTLVGFSMGGGEVARYISRHGQDRLRSIVFAAAVPPFMLRTPDNPEGPLTQAAVADMEQSLREDRTAFFEEFTTGFFSTDEGLMVGEQDLQDAVALCHQSDQAAALGCMKAFGTTDFRDDLPGIAVPVLVLHGSGDRTVPFEGSGARTHRAVPGSELVVIGGAPHGLNVSHAQAFNTALIAFLAK
ncbi:alpha/beta fold hydrolase [Paenirhodobacter populi]|uniref:Alpha/beta hydrolase n=1 Tax=Paenirhodobacter populi TaxID=2306993 RepID=A0A443IY43_9RHOB|nr:alpha/beta hydrolase [Sinirhodobacter populi]RWR13098.1 alpha/beta hydrolase [Sinirhodobacter populi]